MAKPLYEHFGKSNDPHFNAGWSPVMVAGGGGVVELGSGHDGESTPQQQGSSSDSGAYLTWERLSSDSGAYLTWERLRVTVRKGSKSILEGVSGFAVPSQVLAIMGPSGCGKSTLLDALAGRLAANTRQTGQVLINGRKQRLTYGTSAYMTQEDVLTWTLTIREAVYYSAELQLPKSMSRAEKRKRADKTIKDMGLLDSADTRIGGWGSKGISGGQMRRVSICLEILTRPKLLFLDEPTSGLDSAASYHVMNQIVILARQYEMTVVASIHQPSNRVFGLFHNLCLLSSGRTVYFGPTSEANQFFAANGYPCPYLENPADHYLKTINTDFDEDIERGQGDKNVEEVTEALITSYTLSETFMETRRQIERIRSQEGALIVKKGNQAGVFTQSLVLTKRSFVNMYRDLGYYWLRLAIYIALAFGLGSVFYSIGSDFGSVTARGSMLMFVASFLTILAIGGFPSFVEDMKVFQRERLNGHYGAGAFVIGNGLSSVPYLFLISLVPGAITYTLVGLQRKPEQFTYFAMTLFVCMLLVESLMMIVASVVPNFLMGVITGAGVQGLMMLSGGFFRLPNDLPTIFWKYPMYYIAFHRYAFQGLYKNEFEGLRFPADPRLGLGLLTIDGKEVLKEVWQIDMGHSKWVDLGILFGMVVLYRLLFFLIIKAVERMKPVIRDFHLIPYRKERSMRCIPLTVHNVN